MCRELAWNSYAIRLQPGLVYKNIIFEHKLEIIGNKIYVTQQTRMWLVCCVCMGKHTEPQIHGPPLGLSGPVISENLFGLIYTRRGLKLDHWVRKSSCYQLSHM